MKPYKIKGKWYYPKKRVVGDTTTIIIGWYGDKAHLKPTANGEIFNMFDFTTSHRTLPMNTMLLVENLENGKTVIVRVNDRGSFIKGRELDISKKAGQEIDLIKRGTVKAKITILGYNGVKDESLLKNKNLPVKKEKVIVKKIEDKNSSIKNPSRPIFIQNTFKGTNIIENPIYISTPTPKPFDSNSSEQPKNMEKNISTLEKLKLKPEIKRDLEILDKNITDIIEDNSSIKLEKSDATEQPEDWVEEITDLVIKPQTQITQMVIEPIYKEVYYVQVASFKAEDGAKRFTIMNKDILSSNLKLTIREEKKLFRVWVSGFKDKEEAREFNNKKEFFSSSFLVYRNEEVK